MQSDKINEIFEYMTELFGKNPASELNYTHPHELLIAIILSAQCTDKRVNIVTGKLFKKYKTLNDFANANLAELEQDIYSTGFYKNKAKNIKSMAQLVIQNHNGEIPNTLADLEKLPGVGRKTASVFICEYLKQPAIPVDTHVQRVANRLGFSTSKNPRGIERDLAKILDQNNWARYHLQLVLFGRYHCKSQNPQCQTCEIKHHCNYNR
ncbi:MAG: endonuclease III [Firmicutes bacterium]|nr:endonuclease III [Bacillota bacterium]